MNDIIKRTEKVANIMKNFWNKDKLVILCYLGAEKKNVTEIIKCSSIWQSQVSQYLWKMKLEWLLKSEKKWKEVFYSISDKKILKIISALKDIFDK